MNITYLLGAGASANTIPVVAQMHRRIIAIDNELDFIYHNTPLELIPFKSDLEKIVNDLKWLISQAGDVYTIDTLAKKYYLTDRMDEYDRLKYCLIVYFSIEQFLHMPSKGKDFVKEVTDMRYDSFIASIAYKEKDKLYLNDNIQILSWNYDIQFELSLKRFINKPLHQLKQEYNLYPFINDHSTSPVRTSEFSLVKLNGNAIFSVDDKITVFDQIDNPELSLDEKLVLLLKALRELDYHKSVAPRFFNFAWESSNDFDNRIHANYKTNFEHAEHLAKQTDVLVVIGYSFPIFNRQADSALFSKMNSLRKVYIQDVNPERIKSTMLNAFRLLQEKGVDFMEETNLNQFVIPYELND